jgi:hypothetical protein
MDKRMDGVASFLSTPLPLRRNRSTFARNKPEAAIAAIAGENRANITSSAEISRAVRILVTSERVAIAPMMSGRAATSGAFNPVTPAYRAHHT